MSVHVNGLTGTQWLYCMLIALVTFPINLLLKFIPDTMCPMLGDEDPADVTASAADYAVLKKKGEEILQELVGSKK